LKRFASAAFFLLTTLYLWHFYSFGDAELLGSFFISLSRRTIFNAKATSKVPLIRIIKLEEKKEARNSPGWVTL
jgi:hypothetical protein